MKVFLVLDAYRVFLYTAVMIAAGLVVWNRAYEVGYKTAMTDAYLKTVDVTEYVEKLNESYRKH